MEGRISPGGGIYTNVTFNVSIEGEGITPLVFLSWLHLSDSIEI